MKPLSLNALARRFGEAVNVHITFPNTGEQYSRLASGRIVDLEGNDRPDKQDLFAPNARIISLTEARNTLVGKGYEPDAINRAFTKLYGVAS